MTQKEKGPLANKGPFQNIEITVGDHQRCKDIQLPSNLKGLRELKASHLRAKYPNVPPHGISNPKPYTDKTANGLTRCIIDAINLSGGQAERIANTGRVIDNTYSYTDAVGKRKTIGGVKWIPGSGTNGTADISATVAGRSVKVEVKIGLDKLNEAQIRYGKQVEAAGGIYVVARSYEQFVVELERRLS